MHQSAFLMARFFREKCGFGFPVSGDGNRVLEVGSKSYGDQDTFRPLFSAGKFHYMGLDFEDRLHFDCVPGNGFVWREIEKDSFDVCISGQTFEDNPYFWVTFCEIARVLRPGGHVFISAPGAGAVHRFPYECSRFHPDAWRALCSLTGMELVESYFESDAIAEVVFGGGWRDSCLITRTPAPVAGDDGALNARLARLTESFADLGLALRSTAPVTGPCLAAYEAHVAATCRLSLGARFRRGSRAFRKPARLFERDGSAS